MPPADFGFLVSIGIGFFFAPLQFKLIKPRPQHRPCRRAVFMLRTFILTLHDNICRQMGDANGAVRCVDVLATCP